MSTAANEALVRRYWEEAWNGGKLDLLPEMFVPELVAGQHTFISRTREAFSGSHVTNEDLLAVGDKVVVRYGWRATHTGVWDMALADIPMDVPPTGKPVWDRGIAISRLAGGRIVEHWAEWTKLEPAQQLGALAPAT